MSWLEPKWIKSAASKISVPPPHTPLFFFWLTFKPESFIVTVSRPGCPAVELAESRRSQTGLRPAGKPHPASLSIHLLPRTVTHGAFSSFSQSRRSRYISQVIFVLFICICFIYTLISPLPPPPPTKKKSQAWRLKLWSNAGCVVRGKKTEGNRALGVLAPEPPRRVRSSGGTQRDRRRGEEGGWWWSETDY